MTSNNHHTDDQQLLQFLLISGFTKQMMYVCLISLVAVAFTLFETSFSNKYSHYSSVAAARRGIKPNADRGEINYSVSLGDAKYKILTSETKRYRPEDAHSRLGTSPNNNMKHHYSRVVCLVNEQCGALNDFHQTQLRPSWDSVLDISAKTRLSSSSSDVRDGDVNLCELSDPSYQNKTSAPSTCNIIHELDFDLNRMKYLAKGAFKMAWDLALPSEEGREEHYVMKTVVYSKIKASSSELKRNTRDALIMEKAGRALNSYESNVLPMYQYCAITALVPFASKSTLDEHIKSGKLLNAKEMYHLALQAARGLYQMQSYKDGKPTYAHADIKPPQFLLFDPPKDNEEDLPLLQLNDFNRGEILKRSVKNKEPCAFQKCGVHHKGSTYRSPEEYMDCADQSAAIDVFSLGNVFFFMLANGLKPYFQHSYDHAVRDILQGILPELPDDNDYLRYLHFSDEQIDFVIKRSNHPLFVALQDVMKKCWSFDPEDRPTSLEVVQMLEARLQKINQEA
jgi:hypothetical protein